jgi:hypothetical protein
MNRFRIPNRLNNSMTKFINSLIIKCLSIIFLIGFFLSWNNLNAQELKIISVDSSSYPVIKVSFAFQGNTRFEEEQLNIRQDSRKIIYNIQESTPDKDKNEGRAVFFLMEASGNTTGKAMVDLREGVSGSLDNLNPEDILNIGWFGSFDKDSVDMSLLSDKFTDRHSYIRQQLFRINASEDSLLRSDLYKNILEALNYIGIQKQIPEQKLFIVLSTSKNNSSFPTSSSDCISRAKQLNIPVFSVTYLENDSVITSNAMTRLSARTGGKNVQAKTQIGIINAITDFFNIPLPQSIKESRYDIMFTVGMDTNPSKAKIDINYRGNRQILIVHDPAAGQIIPEDFKPYLWYSIGILGLVVVLMLFINIFSRKKTRKNDQEITSEQTNEANNPAIEAKPTEVISSKVETSEIKVEKSDKALPVILLSKDGRTLTYPIAKELITLGRHESNDICLPEITVTGKHAVIKSKDNEITIEDLGSTNGTFVNGERIRNRSLKPGDKITLGKVELMLKE